MAAMSEKGEKSRLCKDHIGDEGEDIKGMVIRVSHRAKFEWYEGLLKLALEWWENQNKSSRK